MAETVQHPDQVIERVHTLDKLGAIVIGSADVYVASGGATRPPDDIDIALDEAAFQEACRTHPDWELTAIPGSSKHHLVGGGFDIGIGWGDSSYTTLKEQAWKAHGIVFAHLADVYAYKQRRNAKTDQGDLQQIRSFIHGVESRPLPTHLTTYEQAHISALIPDELHNTSEVQKAVELASSGLAGIRIIYGDMSRGQVNRVTIDKDSAEHDVIAAYHEGSLHTLNGLRWLMRHMTTVNAENRETGQPVTFSDTDVLDALVIYAYRNALFGNSKSAAIARTHATSIGYAVNSPSIWDLPRDKSPLLSAIQGADGQQISEASGLERAYHLIAESIQLTRIDQAAFSGELRVFSPESLFALADNFPDTRLAPTSLTVKEALLRSMSQAATMIDPCSSNSYQYPEHWTSERSLIRLAHAQALRRHLRAITSGHMSISEGYKESTLRTFELKTKYPELV